MGKKPVGQFSHPKGPFTISKVVKFTHFPNFGTFITTGAANVVKLYSGYLGAIKDELMVTKPNLALVSFEGSLILSFTFILL